ncbi:MAG TPA: hypothetical protein VGJ91_03040 [Polyangiaceae bacterium]
MGVRWLGAIGLGAFLGACAAPAAQTPLSVSKPPATPALASGEFSELGRFQDHGVPSGVIWLRVSAPGRDMPLLATLLGVGSLLDPSEILNRKLGPLARSVDLSKPIDMTVSGLDDGQVRIALAGGIAQPDKFVAEVRQDFRIVHQGLGRWQLLPKAKPARDALSCELWQAAEPIGARLVCASQAALLEQQGEFFLAAARTSVDRANFHAELPGSTVKLALQKGAEQEARKYQASGTKDDEATRAGRALGRKLVDELAVDLSGISWDLTLRRESLEISQVVGFARTHSLLSASLSGQKGAERPVPESFWQLPSESDFALYSEGAERDSLQKFGAPWIQALRSASQADNEDELPSALLDRVEHALDSLLLRGGGFELAYGRDLERAAQTLKEAAEHATDRGARSGSADPALKKAQAQLGGWALFGLEDDSRAYLQALRDALSLAADKTKYPRKKAAKAPQPSPTKLEFRQSPLPAAAGLPPDSLHVVVSSEPNPKYLASKAQPAPPPPSSYHLIAVPDTARHLWFSLSPDEALALARMRAVLAPESAKTLGASAELRQLAKQPLAGIGFATLAGLSELSLSAESKSKVLDSRRTLKGLLALPKRGSTRMPIWITRAKFGNDERRIAINLTLTPDAIGDLLATFLAPGSNPTLVEGE